MILDNNGTTSYEIGQLFDNDGTANHQIGAVYDNNGSANTLIYTAIVDYSDVLKSNTARVGDSNYSNAAIKRYAQVETYDYSGVDTLTLDYSFSGGVLVASAYASGSSARCELILTNSTYSGNTWTAGSINISIASGTTYSGRTAKTVSGSATVDLSGYSDSEKASLRFAFVYRSTLTNYTSCAFTAPTDSNTFIKNIKGE